MCWKVRLLMTDEMCVLISMTFGEQRAMNMCAWHDRAFLVYSSTAGHVLRLIAILSVRWLKLKKKRYQIKFIDLIGFLNPTRTEQYYNTQQKFAVTSFFKVTNAVFLIVPQAECT